MRLNNQTLILLAGAPGTGKTYTENIIKKCREAGIEAVCGSLKKIMERQEICRKFHGIRRK